MKIVFLSDAFLKNINGGGEICDDCICNSLQEKHDILKLETYKINLNNIDSLKSYFFIISNFTLLSEEVKSFIKNNLNYIIYDHDYKFVVDRNPAKYINFKVPDNLLINIDFYKNAKKIICQSTFQKNIFEVNLNLKNIISIGTNFWKEEDYDIIKNMSNIQKKDFYAVLESPIDHKNTIGSVEYCKNNNLQYELIPPMDYKNFLQCFGKYKGFIFLPKTPETFSRTVLEAKMMNMQVISNNLIGCKKEDWYKKYNGNDLIDFTKQKNQEAYKIFEELICNQ